VPAPEAKAVPAVADPVFATKALRKFLSALSAHDTPTLLDLAPVVSDNLNFFGDHLGCKVIIEDTYSEVERLAREGRSAEAAQMLAGRFAHAPQSVDGILCWDLMDYLDRPAAQTLADELTRLLRPDGVLLAFFGTAPPNGAHYTRYVIADDVTLRYRVYPASRARQEVFANRDIIRLFERLRVSDSFLLPNQLREILFRKPAYETR
jgi:SAM-dependent methyltransferase